MCSWGYDVVYIYTYIYSKFKDKEKMMMRHLHCARNTKRNNTSIVAPHILLIFILDSEWPDYVLTQSYISWMALIYTYEYRDQYHMERHQFNVFSIYLCILSSLNLSLFLLYNCIFSYVCLHLSLSLFLFVFSISISTSNWIYFYLLNLKIYNDFIGIYFTN